MASTTPKKHNYPATRKSPKSKRNSHWQKQKTTKFMQVLTVKQWNQLKPLAKARGMTVQEYIRFVVLADFLYKQEVIEKLKEVPPMENIPPAGTEVPQRLMEKPEVGA